MFPLLPVPIASVTTPKYVSPSSWERLSNCRLSVFYRGYLELPESLESIVGSVLHQVRARVLESGSSLVSLSVVLADVIQEFDRRVSLGDNAQLVPLTETVGRQAWASKLGLVKASLEAVPQDNEVGGRSVAVKPSRSAAPIADEIVGDQMPLGVEKVWQCTALRIKGRVDQAFRDNTGKVVIVDFKSGRVVTRDGEMFPGIAAQLGLYALVARKLGDAVERTIVGGSEYVERQFSQDELDDLEDTLRDFLARNPAGLELPAVELASPGAACKFCRLRVQCAAYLRVAPELWVNDGEKPRPLPFDAWGRVKSRTIEAAGLTVRLEDPRGREIVLRGIPYVAGDDELGVGQMLYAFNLVATQDYYQHGRLLHPRAFHAAAPGRRWKPALQARLYLGKPAN